ncbi:hypothetical protein [Carboxylicivirga sp. RSCT41]|uniref:hypothetical protein n=1 Tax=Carboxylicivirga agarovorans TaxID=3417570 RepID=UPI003D3539DE
MKTVVLISALILWSSLAISQEIISMQFEELWWNFKNEEIIDGVQYLNYEGSPYIYESDAASVFLDERKKIEGLTMRYNVYNDLMEIKKGEKFYNVPRERIVPKIKLDEHLFFLMPYKMSKVKDIGYFECLLDNDEKCSLFLKHRILLTEEEVPKPFQEARPPEFKNQTPISYVTFGEDYLMPVLNKKDFIEMIPDNHTEIAQYMKKNKIKFRNPESVKQLIEYYNSL